MAAEVAKAFIFDGVGRVLILRRSDTHPNYALHPDLPGGEVDPGEQALDAVIREIFEETGLRVTPEMVEKVHDEPAHPEDTSHLYLLFVVRVREIQPETTISWEHDAAEWLHPHEVIARGQTGAGHDPYYRMAIGYLKNTRTSQMASN